jgi:ribosomal protein S18 acetylase RimI-like enzyme
MKRVNSDLAVSSFSVGDVAENIRELGELMHACVHAGASIGYVLPYSREDGEDFWTTKVSPAVKAGTRLLLAAREGPRIVGSVQLDIDTPPNQPHRAEVRKLMVHPDCRRRGVARALMAELERRTQELGRSLLTLDTRTGDAAEPLYASMGYLTTGVIPGYCLDPENGDLDPTTIMYKVLSRREP